jgi:RNA polymerase-binding transcription factor DksA
MKPRICVCCGEAIAEQKRTLLLKHENLCHSCANFIDDSGIEALEPKQHQHGTGSTLKTLGSTGEFQYD